MSLFDKILKVYESGNYIRQRKAKIVNMLCLVLLGIGIITFLHAFFVLHNHHILMYIPMLVAVFAYLFIVQLLKKGYLDIATIVMVFFSAAAIWAIMFIETMYAKQLVVFSTDTIVFVYGELFFTVLLSSSRKWVIRFFFIANIIVMVIFAINISMLYSLPDSFISEFLGDNIPACLFVFFLCSAFRRMNEEALARVEQEVALNKQWAETLEKRVELRTAELKVAKEKAEQIAEELIQTRGQLANTAHKAGISDIATSVLHNIGNVLNTVVISTDIIHDTLRKSKVEDFSRAMKVFRAQKGNWNHFLLKDPKGIALLEFWDKIEKFLIEENRSLMQNTEVLMKKVSLVCDILDSQQEYVYALGWTEQANINLIIKDALVILEENLWRSGILITTEYKAQTPVLIQKNKLIHILINLLRNARDSLSEGDRSEKIIWIRTYEENNLLFVEFQDNGCGILEEDLDKIFNSGFTTKSRGKGFGLHSAANHMEEMQGSIRAFSEGPGMGATFLLQFPLTQKS